MKRFYAKDFIETTEGLRFAVLKNDTEQGKVLCFLRYAFLEGTWKKVATQEANQLLNNHYPQYLHYSKVIDAHLHAVDSKDIFKHYSARQQLQHLLQQSPQDQVCKDLHHLCDLFAENGLDLNHIGITGSILTGVQKDSSDIDLVFYQREHFQHARQIIQTLIQQQKLNPLTQQDWQESFQRRACDLSFDDYVWHELRKYNKALINSRKFDISLSQQDANDKHYYKKGKIVLKVKVIDDRYSFDYPAEFLIEHPEIKTIVCFTATYNGQAQTGEWVEVSGQLEISNENEQQIVVGSTREAEGEYIKVIKND